MSFKCSHFRYLGHAHGESRQGALCSRQGTEGSASGQSNLGHCLVRGKKNAADPLLMAHRFMASTQPIGGSNAFSLYRADQYAGSSYTNLVIEVDQQVSMKTNTNQRQHTYNQPENIMASWHETAPLQAPLGPGLPHFLRWLETLYIDSCDKVCATCSAPAATPKLHVAMTCVSHCSCHSCKVRATMPSHQFTCNVATALWDVAPPSHCHD